MKIAFIYSTRKLSGKLTQIFTGSRCYHVAWVDESGGVMYDMHLLRRKRLWPQYDEANVRLVPSPVPVTRDFLERKLLTDNSAYGFIDYCLFALRPIYHLFGFSTRNAKGVICSEMIYNDLMENGWTHRFWEVPSPADLERVLNA